MPLMTELVVAVRRLADEIGRKQQRTITLMARVALEPERNLILVRGGLPGPNGRIVWLQKAGKA